MEIDRSTLRSLGSKPVWEENGDRIALGTCWERACVVLVSAHDHVEF